MATPSATFARFTVSPLNPRIGAEISGIDLRETLDDETLAEIRRALLVHKVIFFRDQAITQEQHIAFARRFGDLEVHPMTPPGQPNREIFKLRGGPEGRSGGDIWHSDVSWRALPSMGSMLIGRTIPETGGDTMWADMTAAYEGLSPAMKDWVERLTAIHDGALFARHMNISVEEFHRQFPPQEHPVVRTHPETGERILYVNRNFTTRIVGLNQRESDWLLDHLCAQASIPEYQCRFRWQPNSIAFWDNRSCQHYAIDDYRPSLREMERVTVIGDRPYFDPSR